ncbi:MAG: RDD family protein [Gemmatimonadaceae bacterium]
MTCPSCSKEIMPDAYFCNWCSSFVPAPAKGTKAGLFRRWFALVIDPVIGVVLYFVGVGLLSAVSSQLGIAAAVILPLVYIVWFLSLLREGLTPGKKLMGLQVVDQQTGQIPGFGKMFIREFVGRFVSGLIFGLGYLWAIIDKNGQAWHDKIANTVVLKVQPPGNPSVSLPPGAGVSAGVGTTRSRSAL